MAKQKLKDPNRLPFSGYAGATLQAATLSIVTALMTSYFMLYLTDYSGLGAFAATLGSTLLVFARIFDAVNDPIEGWIVNKSKVGKNGKYRKFILLSIALMSIGVVALFFIPSSITDKPVFVSVYVIIFYLIYDIGYSFFMQEPLLRSMTLREDERGKLLIGPRMMNMLMGMVVSGMMAIITAVNQSIGDLHTSFGIVVTVLMVIAAVISVVGCMMVKEKYHAPQEDADCLSIKDFLLVFKENNAFRIKMLAGLAGGFIYTLMYAAAAYYLKWAYCADLTTGAVDTQKYGTFMLILSMMNFTPLILGTFLGTPIMKKLGTPDRASRILTLVQAIPLGLLFVLHIIGILPKSPLPLFAVLVITSVAIGAQYIPTGVLNMEAMDYDVYKNKKDRAAIQFTAVQLIGKAQSAFATATVGVVLVSAGYVVDSATDTYIGDLARIPSLLTWFVVIMGLLPLFLGILSYFIMKKYPITPEMRQQLHETVHAGDISNANSQEH